MVSFYIRVYIVNAAGSPVAGVVVTLLRHRISTDTWSSSTLTTGTAGRASWSMYEGSYDYYYFTCEATGWSYCSIQYVMEAKDHHVTFGTPSPPRETSVLSIVFEATPKVSGYLADTHGIGLEGRWVDLYINGATSEGNRTDSEGYYAFYPILAGSYSLQTKFKGDMWYNACSSEVISGGSGVAKAQITTINLPDSLDAGKGITGSIVLTNIGTVAAKLKIFVGTVWDGQSYDVASLEAIGVNKTFTVTIPAGLMVMPDKDAIINIIAKHESSPESWSYITDDTKTH